MTVSQGRWPEWTVTDIAAAIRSGAVSAVAVMDETRRRAEAWQPRITAFAHLDWAEAEAEAAAIDARLRRGEELGALAGVPFAVKDTQDCRGMPTRFGSLARANAPVATADEPYVARLRAAGAIPIGKTATPEFMSGLLTESRALGTTRNPWNTAVTPGGSSGGSAAAVAARIVPLATGSDGGGSIRIPASITGLVGHKTTYGLVPERMRVPSETSTVGVLTWTVADTVTALDVMAGPWESDSPSYAAAAEPLAGRVGRTDTRALRVAYVPHLAGAGGTEEVLRACADVVARLTHDLAWIEVADVVELDVDLNAIFVAAGSADPWIVNDLDDVDDVAPLFSDYVSARLERTAAVSIPALASALRKRRELRRRIQEWFLQVDVILAPTLSTTEIPAEGPPPTAVPGQAYVGVEATAPLTRVANLGGTPSTSVPIGLGANGVPIGLQILTGPHRDGLALAVAARIEEYGLVPATARPELP